jgi:formate C-acetyltransferase
MELNGATAALKSVAKLPYIHMGGGYIFNLKMSPKTFESKAGCAKLASLIRGYCDLNGYQMQFNVVDAKTLRDAQERPEEYRDLMVRVAGYSAYFTTTSKEVQDDIIARAEFGL